MQVHMFENVIKKNLEPIFYVILYFENSYKYLKIRTLLIIFIPPK